MSHLTCVDHKSRIIINANSGDVHHRSDLSECDTTKVRIGGSDVDITVGEFCVMALESN